MEKILSENIANPHEIFLMNYLECPIDNMIPLNPVICKKCETVFCPDCIESWKKKSNICPMRCNPIELMSYDRTILKQQVSKIKVYCTNKDSGCLTHIPVNDIQRHEKNCEYRGSKCPKCEGIVTLINLNAHLHESCRNNVIECFICDQQLNLSEILTHLKQCNLGSVICKLCTRNHSRDNNDCVNEIVKCQLCNLPDISINIKRGKHKCVNNKNQDTNINTHLQFVSYSFDENASTIIKEHDEKFQKFLNKLNEVCSDVFTREKEKDFFMQTKFNKLQEDFAKRRSNMIRDKRELINKMKQEISELLEQKECIYLIILILDKSQEIRHLPLVYEKNKTSLESEYQYKISSKLQTLELLRKLILLGEANKIQELESAENTENHAANANNDLIIQNSSNISQNNSVLCQLCNSDVEINSNKCGNCGSVLCKKCSQQCPNKNFSHIYNAICAKCLIPCSICKVVNQCRACTKKCFYKMCQNNLCNLCFDKNKHQVRPEHTNCKFYKCDSCQTDANCIMTTVYCLSCDRRVCVACFVKSHKAHSTK